MSSESYFYLFPEELLFELFKFFPDLPDVYNFSIFIHSVKNKYYINDPEWCQYLIKAVLDLDVENKCELHIEPKEWPNVYLELLSINFKLDKLDMPNPVPSNNRYIFKRGKEPSNVDKYISFETASHDLTYRLITLKSGYRYDEIRRIIYKGNSGNYFEYKIITNFATSLKEYQAKVTRSYFNSQFKSTEYYENKVNTLKRSLQLVTKYFELLRI